MTDTPNRPPLWEVMRDARFDVYRKAIGVPSEEEYGAAEIRALRDWLVPEQPKPNAYHAIGAIALAWVRWNERQRLRALLTAEADRAERGDA